MITPLATSNPLSREEVQQSIQRLVRRLAPALGSREIALHQLLGSPGLGFDSLTLVQFVTQLEKLFGVELSDDLWLHRDRLTLGDFADSVVRLGPTAIHESAPMLQAVPATSPGNDTSSPPTATRLGRLQQLVHEGGLLRATKKLASQVSARVLQGTYESSNWYLLQRDLAPERLPRPSATIPLTLRTGGPADAKALRGLWSSAEADHKLRRFEERIAAGCVCLLALHQKQAVAIDWLSDTGDDEPQTGLRIRTGPGACYGFDLHEHPEYRAKGAGLALLAFSIAESARRGWKRQFTLVHGENRRMLSAAIQLCGFRRAGEVRTTRVLGRSRATWTMTDGRAGDATTELLL